MVKEGEEDLGEDHASNGLTTSHLGMVTLMPSAKHM